jgi:hypothetical protein
MEATVTKLKKNNTAEVWVCLRDFQGKQYVDIREHFLLAEDRQWHPTAKGIMVLPALLSQVIDGLEALCGVTEVTTVAKFKKSNREEIQIAIREYEGNRYGEIRAWYWAEGGAQKPGKGVTFKPAIIGALLEALRSAEELLEKK